MKGLSPEEAAAKVVGDAGQRPDACVDCCGFESSVATALAAAKSGGKVCLVGMVSTICARKCLNMYPIYFVYRSVVLTDDPVAWLSSTTVDTAPRRSGDPVCEHEEDVQKRFVAVFARVPSTPSIPHALALGPWPAFSSKLEGAQHFEPPGDCLGGAGGRRGRRLPVQGRLSHGDSPRRVGVSA